MVGKGKDPSSSSSRKTKAQLREERKVREQVEKTLPGQDKRGKRHVKSLERYAEAQRQWPRNLSGLIDPLLRRKRGGKKRK